MAEYRAKPGVPDRDGEMTGAITINMILCMPLITVWAIFIAPALGVPTWLNAVLAVTAAIVMPLACLGLSRRIWAWFSTFMDREDF